jgi:hypothetical protein
MKPKTRLKKLLDGKYSPKKNAGFAFELNVNIHKETVQQDCNHTRSYELGFVKGKSVCGKCGKVL